MSDINKKLKVFLGGTCNESTWREEIIPKLKIDYFNPVVDDWTEDCIIEENRQKIICDYNLFVITKEMTGVYSIAEAVDMSNKKPLSTIFCILEDRFDKGQIKSLNEVYKMIKNNGAFVFKSLEDVVKFLNDEEI